MKSLVALTTMFLLVTLCGCGTSSSIEDDAEQFVRQKLTERKSPIKLVSFHKTHGYDMNCDGVDFYLLYFQGEIEFTEDCLWDGES